MKTAKVVSALVATMLSQQAVYACVPDVRGPKFAQIGITKSGELCDLRKLPKPWDTLNGIQQGTSRSFHWGYEEHQHAYLMFKINKRTGKGTADFHYTNDKILDGDHFASSVEFLDKYKKSIGYITSIKGLNPKSAGSDIKNIANTPEYWASVRYIRIRYHHVDEGSDKKFWGTVVKGIEAACMAYGASCGMGGP